MTRSLEMQSDKAPLSKSLLRPRPINQSFNLHSRRVDKSLLGRERNHNLLICRPPRVYYLLIHFAHSNHTLQEGKGP